MGLDSYLSHCYQCIAVWSSPLSCLLVLLLQNKLCNQESSPPLLAPLKLVSRAQYVVHQLFHMVLSIICPPPFLTCFLQSLTHTGSIQTMWVKCPCWWDLFIYFCQDSCLFCHPCNMWSCKIRASRAALRLLECSQPFGILRHSSLKCTLAFSNNALHVVECLWSGPPCRCLCVCLCEWVFVCVYSLA